MAKWSFQNLGALTFDVSATTTKIAFQWTKNEAYFAYLWKTRHPFWFNCGANGCELLKAPFSLLNRPALCCRESIKRYANGAFKRLIIIAATGFFVFMVSGLQTHWSCSCPGRRRKKKTPVMTNTHTHTHTQTPLLLIFLLLTGTH